MEQWLKLSLFLCFFGFLKEIRPSEPFITDFLIQSRNISDTDVLREVYPYGTYSYMAQLIIVFLITDFLRYKPLIIVTGLSGIIVWYMLAWTKTITELKILEIFYGTYMSTEVAYFTYIYAKVDKEHYQSVTSHTRAAILCGKFIAGTIGQFLIYFQLMNYLELNYITLAAQICATFWAILLPSVNTSLYFNRTHGAATNYHLSASLESQINTKQIKRQSKMKDAFHLIWLHLKCAYTNAKVIQWSFWYAVGTCLFLQVISYGQVLWTSIDSRQESIWNGAVEAIITLIGATVTLFAGKFNAKESSQKFLLFLLSILSICCGLAVMLATITKSRYISYVGYVLFFIVYTFVITIASSEIAKHLEEDSFGLVFGINTFLALVMQTVLTIFVVTDFLFNLTIFQQYFIYSYLFIFLGIIYFIASVMERKIALVEEINGESELEPL